MDSDDVSKTFLIEKRLPVCILIILVGWLLWHIPERISIVPQWFAIAVPLIMILPISAVGLSKGNLFWIKIEKYVIMIFILLIGIGNLMNLQFLINEMIFKSNLISGIQLLGSSIAIWVMNVFVFSLLYWQIDRGGPEARLNSSRKSSDWYFSIESSQEPYLREKWNPVFVDYLFLAFSTSTAFSATDTLPITPKAKLLLMLQSLISLIIIVVVGARAINIIGS